MKLLLALLFVLVAAGGAAVVFSREPRRQVLALSVNGLLLALLFLALQAPDVAYSELTVGTAALPLLFLVTLASMRTDRKAEGRRPRLRERLAELLRLAPWFAAALLSRSRRRRTGMPGRED